MANKAHANSLTLNLATLGDLSEGYAQAVIDQAIKAAIRDTEDRGKDKKERKVVITLRIKKIGDSGVVVAVEAEPKVPKYLTPETIGDIHVTDGGRNAEMRFSSASAENPDQPAIPGTRDEK
jgi:hypothetical protein